MDLLPVPPFEGKARWSASPEPVLERARQILATQAPASNIQGFLGTTQGLGGAAVMVIIGVLMAVTLLLCLAALVVIAVDRLIERRRLTAALRIVGVPRRAEAAADLAEVALPLVISAALAMAATAGAVHAAIEITGVTTGRLGQILLTQVGLTAAAVVLLTAVVYAGTLLRTSSEGRADNPTNPAPVDLVQVCRVVTKRNTRLRSSRASLDMGRRIRGFSRATGMSLVVWCVTRPLRCRRSRE